MRRSSCLKAENALPAAENGVQTISKRGILVPQTKDCIEARSADYFRRGQTLFSCPKPFSLLEVTRQTISPRVELYNTIMSRGVGWQTISNPAPLYRGPTAKRAAFSSPTKSSVSVKKTLTPPASPSRLAYPLSDLSCPRAPAACLLTAES